jgi:hypothetical protein
METGRDKPRVAKRAAALDRDPVVDELARTLAKERELHAQQLALLRKESHEYREAAATARQQEAALQHQLEQAKATGAKARAAKMVKSDTPRPGPVSKPKLAVTANTSGKAAKVTSKETDSSAPKASIPKATTTAAVKRTSIPRRAPLRNHLTSTMAARAQSMLEAVWWPLLSILARERYDVAFSV